MEKKQQRGELVKQMRDLIERAEAEKRALTAEEAEQFDRLDAEQEQLRAQIEREEKLAERERELAQIQQPLMRMLPGDTGVRQVTGPATTDKRLAFRSWLVGGWNALRNEELRALQADSDPAGGFLVPSEEIVNQLIKNVDDEVFIRQLATKFTVPRAEALGVPRLDADPSDADWTVELDAGAEDSAMAFGKRALHPHPLAKRIKVSNKLLRAAMQPAEDLVLSRLAYKFGIAQEKAFMTGSGAGQPLGLFTASADGISTNRDVSTGNTTTDISADNIIECLYTLKPQYQRNAQFCAHRDYFKRVRKLKDGDGQYLWQPGLQAGQPDTILGRPMFQSEYAPNTFASGKYVMVVGVFSNYWIVDAMTLQFQRLVELYAETNQTGFIGRLETDGAPVIEEAFVRSKLA